MLLVVVPLLHYKISNIDELLVIAHRNVHGVLKCIC